MLPKVLIALGLVSVLLAWSVIVFFRGKAAGSLLQLLGAGCLLVVVLTHVCEALHLFPVMHWGSPHSLGHYLDFFSASLGLTFLCLGYLMYMFTRRPT